MQPPIGCPTEGCLVTSSSTSYRHVSKTYPRKGSPPRGLGPRGLPAAGLSPRPRDEDPADGRPPPWRRVAHGVTDVRPRLGMVCAGSALCSSHWPRRAAVRFVAHCKL